MRIKPIKKFRRIMTAPPDKSITHRALILGALAGDTVVENPLISADTLSTVRCLEDLGSYIVSERGALVVGKGFSCSKRVDAGNSGTTMRLLAGVTSPLISCEITGDRSLRGRNMDELCRTLSKFGANIKSSKGGLPPLVIEKSQLTGTRIETSSAQIKSAALLAGLNSQGKTEVVEMAVSRSHTETLLARFGADIERTDNVITLRPSVLKGQRIRVGGDLSSAAYAIALSIGAADGFAFIRGVDLDEGRTGMIDKLIGSGADIKKERNGEFYDLEVKSGKLSQFSVRIKEVPSMIDELPLMAVMACLIQGRSTISGVTVLKNKESDRLAQTIKLIKAAGGEIKLENDSLIIDGKGSIAGGITFEPLGDHRMAMSAAVLFALSEKGGVVTDEDCVQVSYPDFWELFI